MKIDENVFRVDSQKKIRGESQYIEDLSFDDLYFCRTLRSEVPRATIVSIDYPELPEGYYIVDQHDVETNAVKMIETDMPIFSDGTVNYVGEPIALIVGKDKDKVIELLEKTKVTYKEFPAIFSMEEAKSNRIQLLEYNNIFSERHFSLGDLEQAKKDGKVFKGIYTTKYQEQLYMEKQGFVGTFDGNQLTVYGSMQCPYYVMNALLHSTGLSREDITVIQSETGGAFGGKEEYPSLMACQVAAAAMKIQKPVRLIFDRREDIMYTTKRHPSKTYIETYYQEDRILGMSIAIEIDGGPYLGLSDVVLQRAILTLTGAYTIENLQVNGKVYATNNVFTGAFRGFGAPQSMFALEQHMNQLARKLKIDPLAFRKKHFAHQGDITSTGGRFVEPIKLEELTDKLIQLSDYQGTIEDTKDHYRGVGFAVIPHGGGFTGDGEAEHIKAKVYLKKRADDKIEILVSNVEMGQGAKTVLSKIVASTLDIPIEQVIYENPNTDYVPDSGPTVASRTTMVVGNLLQRAALKLKERMTEEEFMIEENFKAPDYLVWDQENLHGNAYMSYSWAGIFAEVAIDKITLDITVTKLYGVFDIGYPMDEKLVEGQIHGGMIQGLGYGLLENMESEAGKIIQNNFEAYSVPTAMDIPEMKYDLVINKYEEGPFGAKALGELPLVGVAPAIASAIEAAIDRNIYKIPVTPEYLLEVREYEKNNQF